MRLVCERSEWWIDVGETTDYPHYLVYWRVCLEQLDSLPLDVSFDDDCEWVLLHLDRLDSLAGDEEFRRCLDAHEREFNVGVLGFDPRLRS